MASLRTTSFVLRIATAALLFAHGAHAADAPLFAAPAAGQAAEATGSGSIGQVTIALGVVLAFVFAAAWALRHLRKLNLSGTTQQLQVVAQLSLGAKERAVLIRVNDMHVLVGVAPGRITALHTSAAPQIEPETAPVAAGNAPVTPVSFQALLKKSLGLTNSPTPK